MAQVAVGQEEEEVELGAVLQQVRGEVVLATVQIRKAWVVQLLQLRLPAFMRACCLPWMW